MRVGAPVAWGLGSVLMVAGFGVPTSHDAVFLWFGLGMAAFSATDLRRRVPRLVIEWLPFVGVLLLYDRLRGYADGLLFHARALPQIRVEAAIFGTPIPTVWLQQHLWHGADHIRWWDYLVWFVYLTHFLASFVVAAVLWVWFHDRFARFATMVCVLALTGFATYVLYPAVPPWMAAQHGDIGAAHRTVKITWSEIPIAHFGSVFEKGQHYANNVAAMPSLHAGYAMLIALYLWRIVPRWARVPLALYPPAMAFSLVYSGEHYVVDCLAGWAYALGSFLAVNWWFAHREAREPSFASAEPVLVD